MARLRDKIAIVIGGGTGIGEATCHRFAEEGARVAIFEKNAATGAQTEQSLRGQGAEVLFLKADVCFSPRTRPVS